MPFFSVALGGSSPNMNANSRRKSTIPGSAERYSETSYKQTPQEHQALLDQFKGVKGMAPEIAEALGREAEAKSPRYWDGDATPRYGGSTPSSSFITGVNVNPAIGLATITMKNGRTYSYPVSAEEAGQMINSNSLGGWYNRHLKLGRSNIPEQITSRSGAINGPSPFTTSVAGGRPTMAGTESAINTLASVVGPAAAIGLVAGLYKKYRDSKESE